MIFLRSRRSPATRLRSQRAGDDWPRRRCSSRASRFIRAILGAGFDEFSRRGAESGGSDSITDGFARWSLRDDRTSRQVFPACRWCTQRGGGVEVAEVAEMGGRKAWS